MCWTRVSRYTQTHGLEFLKSHFRVSYPSLQSVPKSLTCMTRVYTSQQNPHLFSTLTRVPSFCSWLTEGKDKQFVIVNEGWANKSAKLTRGCPYFLLQKIGGHECHVNSEQSTLVLKFYCCSAGPKYIVIQTRLCGRFSSAFCALWCSVAVY